MKNRLFLLLVFISFFLFSQKKQPKVGLVLSGGGAKGFAHIGVLKELERSGIQIDYIGGTSMGAMIGALYAAGYSPDEIERKIMEINFEELIQDKIPRSDLPLFYKKYQGNIAISLPISNKGVSLPKGVAKGQNAQNYFTELFSGIATQCRFKDLPIPFFCVATDIETGEKVVMEEGDLAVSVRASGAFPTLVHPVKIGGKLLVDGGVVDNFPVKELRKKGMDIIIGVDVQQGLLEREDLTSALSVLSQITAFKSVEESKLQTKDVDVYLKPDVKGFNVVSFDKSKIIIDNGEIEAKKFTKIFDSISKLQSKRKIKKKYSFNEHEKFLIDQIHVKGTKSYDDEYVLGTLGVSTCDSLSYHDISSKINKLTGTNNFSDIYFSMKSVRNGKRLDILLEEVKQKSYLGLGIHYDQIFGSSMLTNYTYKNLFGKNDIFSFDLIIGDNLRYNLNYFIDNGFHVGLGFNSSLISFNQNVFFFGDNINKLNVRFIDFKNTFYLQTKFKKKYALDIGVSLRGLKATSETILLDNKPITYENCFYGLSYVNLVVDKFDKRIYPTKGVYFNGRFDWVFCSNRNYKSRLFVNNSIFKPFTQFRAMFSSVNTVAKLSFQQTYEAGLSMLSSPTDGFKYKIGGYNQNLPDNFVPFYGLPLALYMKNNYVKTLGSLRYNFIGAHNILADVNLVKIGKKTFLKDNLIGNIYSGYAFGYGYSSLIGPIELRATWSKNYDFGFLFNLGFWM